MDVYIKHEFLTFGGPVGGVWRCAEVLMRDNAQLMTEIEIRKCQEIALRLCLILRTLQNKGDVIHNLNQAQELLDSAWEHWHKLTIELLSISEKLGSKEITDILAYVSLMDKPQLVQITKN